MFASESEENSEELAPIEGEEEKEEKVEKRREGRHESARDRVTKLCTTLPQEPPRPGLHTEK